MKVPDVLPLLFPSPVQYVSALRPPKKRYQSTSGLSIDSDLDEDVWSHNKLFQRRPSLTFPKTFGTRSSFQNRSLQDFSDRIKDNTVDEAELARRRQSIFNAAINRPDNETSASNESISSDTTKDEWKQVRTGVC